ncbi:MAG: sulfotransferase [Actinomycetota bacterium]
MFDSVERFCLFIGYPRSGHSLVGSLLDAHRNVVLAHELDALRYVSAGYRRKQLYWMILQRDAEFTRSGRRWTEFDYSVPGQWQGRYEQLRIIGDKKGGVTTLRLGRHPELLERLRLVAGKDVRLIHVARNPFDNIATMSRRTHQTLAEASDQFFALCRTVQGIKERSAPGSVIDIRHEGLIKDPRGCLSSLCTDLGIPISEEYLDACAAVVAPSPHLSRHEAPWTEKLIGSVEGRMAAFNFLDGYSFAR